jgi:hypothetical protein
VATSAVRTAAPAKSVLRRIINRVLRCGISTLDMPWLQADGKAVAFRLKCGKGQDGESVKFI